MGKAAKITRGGNKKRMNPGRAEMKQKALGAKSHGTSAKEAEGRKLALKKKSQRIAEELRLKASSTSVGARQCIVRMASRPKSVLPPSVSAENCAEKDTTKFNEEI